MLDTKNMSKLTFGRGKLERIKNKYELSFIPKPSITYDEFIEKNKDMDADKQWRLWLKLENQEIDDLNKNIYDDLLKLPKSISTITDSFTYLYNGLIKTSLCHERKSDYNKKDSLYFKKYLIEKYNLDGFQLKVMEGNQDLIDILYFEYEIIDIQNKGRNLPYFMYDGSIGDKLVKNLKLLINNDDMYNMGLNNFSLLLDSYIFYIDIEKLLDEYKNITVEDLKKLLFISREEFCNIITLLNNCSEELKSKIIYLIEPLKSDSEIFPCLLDDIVDNDKSKTITIIDKNNIIFKEYNYFFKDNLDIFKLIKQYENNTDIIDFLVTLKKAFIYNIPSLVDTRRNYTVTEYYMDEVKGYNCGEYDYVECSRDVHISEGKLYTGENIVKKYVDIIKFVFDSINTKDIVEVEDLFDLNIDVEGYNFLSSAYGMYVMNKNLVKIKKRRYEYNGNKPRL